MSNCLFTKLKSVVDNESIPYYGELVFNLVDTYNGGAIANDSKFFKIATSEAIDWESDVEMFRESSHSTSLGYQGTLQPGSEYNIYFNSPGKLIVHPKYSITSIRLGDFSVYLDVSGLNYLPQTTIINRGFIYGDLENLKNNINLINYLDSQVLLPISYNMKGYNKINVDSGVNSIAALLSFNETNIESMNETFVGGSLDGITDISSVQKLKRVDVLNNITYLKSHGMYINNIENFATCINMETFITYSMDINSGSIVTALSEMTSLKDFKISGGKTKEDLATLFNAWKNAGRKSVGGVDNTCRFYYLSSKYSVTGYPSLTDGNHTVTFDANGDWTIS